MVDSPSDVGLASVRSVAVVRRLGQHVIRDRLSAQRLQAQTKIVLMRFQMGRRQTFERTKPLVIQAGRRLQHLTQRLLTLLGPRLEHRGKTRTRNGIREHRQHGHQKIAISNRPRESPSTAASATSNNNHSIPYESFFLEFFLIVIQVS